MAYGVKQPSLLSWLNPFDAIKNVEAIILYWFSEILYSIQMAIEGIFSLMMSVFQDTVRMFIQAAISLGPLSLPVFLIGTTVVIGSGLIIFAMAKDTPVVGSFV